jgi:hypothetical protein
MTELSLPTVLAGKARDPADEAMSIRAWDRYRAPRRSRWRRRRKRHAAMPNLIVLGGLKCGTTSFHHYLGLHPEIQMSKPKELSFFVSELNWVLGRDWYASRFDRRFPVRGESSPHYTNLPRFEGVAERMRECCPDAKLIYLVRDPIERLLSHWLQNCGSGYETREMAPTVSDPESPYVYRSRYWLQLQPFLEAFDESQVAIFTQEEMKAEREETMRRAFRFAGVREDFSSEEFEREWERTGNKAGTKYRFLNTTVRFPLMREFDERFDRLPESLRWLVERIVHDPRKPAPPKPELTPELAETLRGYFAADVAALQEFAGRRFEGWRGYE